jgi:hypothetical protein
MQNYNYAGREGDGIKQLLYGGSTKRVGTPGNEMKLLLQVNSDCGSTTCVVRVYIGFTVVQ